ncbi:TPA: hypothetical protein EYP70_06470 [Candidatus Bathyarchaeota archaeon]|nr:hypothetical protein [Candidatus Bathyarchaeota archaeon]
MDYRRLLKECKNYGDIFDLVKRAVRETLDKKRAGLMLYLGDFPLNIGAYYTLGSNGIVVNRRILDLVSKSAKSTTEVNSFLFTILLHEYLHSLDYINEREVRKLVYEITRELFGSDHPTVHMALNPPLYRISALEAQFATSMSHELELVKDFERSNQSYIA